MRGNTNCTERFQGAHNSFSARVLFTGVFEAEGKLSEFVLSLSVLPGEAGHV